MTTAAICLGASFVLAMAAGIVDSVVWNSEGIVYILGSFSSACLAVSGMYLITVILERFER